MPAEPAPPIAPGACVGNYLFGELVSRGVNTLTWAGTMVSTGQEVTICSLMDAHMDDQLLRQNFAADVRAKAMVHHPLVASVLGGANNRTHCFFATEKLPGKSLAECYDAGTSITPANAAGIIRNVASACHHLETQTAATLPLSPHEIFIDDHFHCRIINMVVFGEPDATVPTRDKAMLGQLVQDLLQPGQPGFDLTNALCDSMADLHPGQPLSWTQIHARSKAILEKIHQPGTPPPEQD